MYQYYISIIVCYPIQYLAAPREDERPDVAAVKVLGAVEQDAGRLHGHGGHLMGKGSWSERTSSFVSVPLSERKCHFEFPAKFGTYLVLGGEVRHDVGEGSVEGALAVEGTLELQEGAVPLVGGLLGQRERLLAAHRVVPEMKQEMRWRIGSKKQQKLTWRYSAIFKNGKLGHCPKFPWLFLKGVRKLRTQTCPINTYDLSLKASSPAGVVEQPGDLFHGEVPLLRHVAPAGRAVREAREAVDADEVALDALLDGRRDVVQADRALHQRQHRVRLHRAQVHVGVHHLGS